MSTGPNEKGTTQDERGTSTSERGTSTAQHRTSLQRLEELDAKPTTSWAIASLANPEVGFKIFAAGTGVFHLLNRESWRAHLLFAPGAGIGVGLPIGKMGKHDVELPSPSFGFDVSYVAFETPRPLAFADFDHMSFRLTVGQIGLIWGYSLTYLTLWKGLAYFGEKIAYVSFEEGAFMLPGGNILHGATILARGSGEVLGKPGVPRIIAPIEDGYLPERLSYIKQDAHEGPAINLPGDMLFDFDSSKLRENNLPELIYLADLLHTRRTYPVIVEGHTDSIGGVKYNRQLSMRRADSVRNWLIARKVYGAKDFQLKAYGETNPIAPNKLPDGSDNPAGRAKNRRVTVRATWTFVR